MLSTNRKVVAALAAVVGLAAAPAKAGLIGAGEVVIEFDGSIFKTGYDGVQLYHPDQRIGGGVAAGMFHGDAVEAADGFDPAVLYRGLEDVLLYCIDLFQSINGGASPTYDVYSLDGNTPNVQSGSNASGGHPLERNFDRTLDFLGALNYVLNVEEFGYNVNRGEYSWLNPKDRWMSGAIQVGIWESLYEGGPDNSATDPLADSNDFQVTLAPTSTSLLSVDHASAGRGDFYVTGLSTSGSQLLKTTFDQMGSVDALDPSKVLVLTSATRQDMIVGDPPINVPAPAPAVLVLAGLILMARRHAGLT